MSKASESAKDRRVFTLGFSGKTRPELMKLLNANKVEQLLDVRWFPGSLHRPDVSKNNLAKACHEAEIDYVHLKALGAPPEIRKRYKIEADFDALIKEYGRYLVTQEDSVERLATLAAAKRSVVFCTEQDWRACHRKRLAEVLEGRGFRSVHL